jgi:hypothetical protein
MEVFLKGPADSAGPFFVVRQGCFRGPDFRLRMAIITSEAQPAVGTVTLVYNHHVRDLSEKLTEQQHSHHDQNPDVLSAFCHDQRKRKPLWLVKRLQLLQVGSFPIEP